MNELSTFIQLGFRHITSLDDPAICDPLLWESSVSLQTHSDVVRASRVKRAQSSDIRRSVRKRRPWWNRR